MLFRFWSSLLLLMFIPIIILLPNGCNAGGGPSAGKDEIIEEEYQPTEQIEFDDENANRIVTEIFNKMPTELQQNKKELLEDAKTAQRAFNRFMTISRHYSKIPNPTLKEKGILEHKALDIFNFKFGEKGNDLSKLVASKIEIVKNAVKFYKLNNAFEKVKKGIKTFAAKFSDKSQQKSQASGLEEDMAKQLKQMKFFKSWLENILRKNLHPIFGMQFLEAMVKNDSPFVEKNEAVEDGHNTDLHHQQELAETSNQYQQKEPEKATNKEMKGAQHHQKNDK